MSPQPALRLLIDRSPRRKVVRYHAPGGASAHQPALRVEHAAQVMLALLAVQAEWRQIATVNVSSGSSPAETNLLKQPLALGYLDQCQVPISSASNPDRVAKHHAFVYTQCASPNT